MQHQNYWSKRNELAEKARSWTDKMYTDYIELIKYSVRHTENYNENMASIMSTLGNFNRPKCVPDFKIKEMDTVSAIFALPKESEDLKVCVLNFASYKEPGGKFLDGSKAQEECLCHESFLYNVLKEFDNQKYYDANKKALNKALYYNRALYSPEIAFIRGNDLFKRVDVLTCAAPNFTAAKKYCGVTEAENEKALRSRICFILDIMEEQHVDIPILGAFGCGVFGQDAITVATMFKQELESGRYGFKEVVFAIIPGPNSDDFKMVFEQPVLYEYTDDYTTDDGWYHGADDAVSTVTKK